MSDGEDASGLLFVNVSKLGYFGGVLTVSTTLILSRVVSRGHCHNITYLLSYAQRQLKLLLYSRSGFVRSLNQVIRWLTKLGDE